MSTGKRLTGINPLSYSGVEASAPPQLVIQNRQPTVNDLVSFNLGTLWMMSSPQELWILVSKSHYTANWVQLYPGAGGGATDFPCDVDTASEAGGVLKIKGMAGKNINTKGTGNLVEVALNDSVYISGEFIAQDFITSMTNIHAFTGIDTQAGGLKVYDGGIYSVGETRLASLTAGVMQTDGLGVVSSASGTDGQVLIGGTGFQPAWANITAGTGITVTNAANSITIEATGGGGSGSYAFLGIQKVDALSELAADPVQPTYIYLGTCDTNIHPPVYTGMDEMYDNGGNFFPGDGVNPAVFTAPEKGIYQLYATVELNQAINYEGRMAIEIRDSLDVMKSRYCNFDVAFPNVSKHPNPTVLINVLMEAGDKALVNYMISTWTAGQQQPQCAGIIAYDVVSPITWATWFTGFMVTKMP